MLTKRKTSSSFDPITGRRIQKFTSCSTSTCGTNSGTSSSSSCTPIMKRSNFSPKFVIQRRSFMSSLPLGGLTTNKFKRPMIKRRSYDKNADVALKKSSLGQKKRMDGMSKLLARAGKGLSYKLQPMNRLEDCDGSEGDDSQGESDEEKEDEKPFEPLMVWHSPHNGGEAKGLPPTLVKEMQPDEYGIESEVTVVRPAPIHAYIKEDQYVPPVLAKWLRPHQREGVEFMYNCVMGMKTYDGYGCILADDMGLGKTLQSVALIYTMLKTGIQSNKEPTAKRVIVVCPCSLVKNWDNEFVKWLGPGVVKTLALAESDRKTVEKSMDLFVRTKMFNVLICSYETIRTHIKRLNSNKDCCDLLVCDEAHRLKNNENQTSKALNSLPVRRRVLLTGTPMQNDLQEFFAMVDFTNPGVLGTQEEFRKNLLFPVLRGREPDATERQRNKMMEVQKNMSNIVDEFILRRVNTLNAQHLPPKLVQVVCCNLTEIQKNMYQHLISSKDTQHVLDGKQVNCLSSIQMLMKLCNHPRLVAEEDTTSKKITSGRRAASKNMSYAEDEKSSSAPGADGVTRYLPADAGGGGRGGMNVPVRPEWSGKMFVLYRLMKEMRKPGNGNDKIVIVSNYTQTLDLIGRMCRENTWRFCRLDGSIAMKKRQKMVEEFNDPSSSLIAFLLSSKAGGCGLNLIGGNRLVLFDPDWNPAVDKQAAARCWRDGQKKRCFTYRFLATGTVEEKIFQRQLSKEGLQSIVDDKEQVNELSTKDLRNLFKLRVGTPSDTHDKLRCERCEIIADNADQDAMKVLPMQLSACKDLLEVMTANEDASLFLSPLKPEDHGVSSEDYDKVVKQPIDLGTIRAKLNADTSHNSSYKSPSEFSKDVNRIFTNVVKVWEPGQEIADAARLLQTWWMEQWKILVPRLMTMKPDSDKENVDPDSSASNEDAELQCAFVHNERGDDFQEQIGMPDEENMRHWSHHFSTDTVDDPVFRAAMRGYDDVSFVFGLEVTWSLIQEREKEEEEKAAMMELERLQTIEEENDDKEEEEGHKALHETCEEKKDGGFSAAECASTTMEKEKTSPTCTATLGSSNTSDTESDKFSDDDDDDDGATWNVSSVYSVEDIQSNSRVLCQIDDCKNVACSLWQSDKGEQSIVCLLCQDEEFGGWPDGWEPKDANHKKVIEMYCNKPIDSNADKPQDVPIHDNEVVIDITSPTSKPSAPASSPDSSAKKKNNSSTSNSIEWSCLQCTLFNKASARKCIACGMKRSPKKRKKN